MEALVTPRLALTAGLLACAWGACVPARANEEPVSPPEPAQELRVGGIWMVKGANVGLAEGQSSESDLYTWAVKTRVDGNLAGDLWAFATEVQVPGAVRGDMLAFALDVSIDGSVDEGLRAAANEVRLHGTVGRNAVVFANQFRVEPAARIAGSVAAYAGVVSIGGALGGSLVARAGKVEINGPIDGDVDVRCDELTFGPAARIGGALTYSASNDVAVPPGLVSGSVQRATEERAVPSDAESDEGHGFGLRVLARGYLAVVALVAGIALLLFFRPFVDGALERMASGNGLGASFGIGLVGLLVLLVAGVLCLCLLQLPLAAGIWSALGALVYFGGIIGKIALGLWALMLVRQLVDRGGIKDAVREGERRMHPVLALVVGVALLFVVSIVPYAGALAWLLVTVTGMGAALLQLRGGRTDEVLHGSSAA